MNHSSRLQTWFARKRDGWFLMIGSSAVNSFQTVNTYDDQSPLRLRKSCYLLHREIKDDSKMFNGKLLSTNRITVTAWFVFEFLHTCTTPYSSGQQNWHVWPLVYRVCLLLMCTKYCSGGHRVVQILADRCSTATFSHNRIVICS